MRTVVPSVLFALLVAACADKTCPPAPRCPPVAAAPSAPAAPALDAIPAAANPVQHEMRMMTQILEATVRGIGARDVRAIDEQLHGLHAAKEATTQAVKSGAYKLPKNPDNVAGFIAMDEAFHEHLGTLVLASRANDVPRAAEALGAIMRGCHGCHEAYRP